jgi:hypothetical protein
MTYLQQIVWWSGSCCYVAAGTFKRRLYPQPFSPQLVLHPHGGERWEERGRSLVGGDRVGEGGELTSSRYKH